MVGVSVGRATFYLYELVGECVYLYVGRGRDGQEKVGQTNDNRGKDVVPSSILIKHDIEWPFYTPPPPLENNPLSQNF